MSSETLSLSSVFEPATEADWTAAVEKALKGRGPEALVKPLPGGLSVRPLYRETDTPSASDPYGQAGHPPFIRGGQAARDSFLPWDIRQVFAQADPEATRSDIMEDLIGGVSSVELKIDPTGANGVAISTRDDFNTVLDGVMADIAPVAIDSIREPGLGTAALLAGWASAQDSTQPLQLAFNMDPLGALAKSGMVEGGLDAAMADCAALATQLAAEFPDATTLRIDVRPVYEAGGSPQQELAALIGHGVDTLRRLDGYGLPPAKAAEQILFTLAVDANYGVEIAKLRAARRLWARCLALLDLPPRPMRLQAVTGARGLTRYDPWVNMLRGTGAAFAAAVGGADIVSVTPFNSPLGAPDALGRRVARNTQIIAMEESHLGRVADPAGGAWFSDTLANEMAEAAWAEFQQIEREGGYGASLMSDAFQARVAEVRTQRRQAIAKRKTELTGVSAFPLLDEVPAPVAAAPTIDPQRTLSTEALSQRLPSPAAPGEDSLAEPLPAISLAEAFERLRDHAAAREAKTGERPSVFLATLGPLSEHTARADFARGVFAAGGIASKEPPVPPQTVTEAVAAWKASNCRLAVICGSDARYGDEAAALAAALHGAGAQRIYLAGRPGDHETAWRAAGIASFIYVGVDVVATLELAHAELGINE